MNSIEGSIQWGIIGCGDVCEVKSGPAFNKAPNSKLVAVMRRNKAKAEDYARRHGVPVAYDEATRLINDPQVNAVYIATPPAFHEEYTLMALEAGKPVYVEKPVALNAASCERMIKAVDHYKQKVTVAHYRRALPVFKKIKTLVQSGIVGDVRLLQLAMWQSANNKIIAHTEQNWRLQPELSGGGLFHDLAPHQLDILYWLFGAPVAVYGRSFNQSKLYEAPDAAMLNIIFEKDICCNGSWNFSVADVAARDTCEIIGDQGLLRFSFFRQSAIEITTGRGTEIITADFPQHIQQPMINDVVHYFRGEAPNPCSLEEALVVMQMMDTTL